MKSTIINNKNKYNSYYDKTVKNYIKLHIKVFLLGIITLGLAYPWIVCMKQKAKCENMVICGKRLKFIGNPKDLISCWILWFFLTIITLGVYWIIVKVRFEQWIVANTIFEEVENNKEIDKENINKD
ncbi:MAG: hypothetical protein ACRC57_04660 [Sarcina sp.]